MSSMLIWSQIEFSLAELWGIELLGLIQLVLYFWKLISKLIMVQDDDNRSTVQGIQLHIY
ncbi:hypothetical protein Gohar_012258 [Gossypium harknessii]|uniref:Uncharacterized protein n=1 Tax=Gossypium harknessii TaxID=34285 RepID=A0A7J9GWQ2_9ROSI|nr:hypothetical protein [Gossypium harknessii]